MTRDQHLRARLIATGVLKEQPRYTDTELTPLHIPAWIPVLREAKPAKRRRSR